MRTVPPPVEPVADLAEPAASVAGNPHASWYDPDASSWDVHPPALFEALRASPPRSPIAVGSGRGTAVRRGGTATPRPIGRTGRLTG